MGSRTLEERIARLPCWRSEISLVPLKGGLTNLAFVATDGASRFVVRCGGDIPAHHIFRERERAAQRAAHAAGLSPEIVHAETGILVLRFIDGRTLEEKDLRADLARIIALLKTCHREVGRHLQGPANAFWVFHVIRDYVRLVGSNAKYLRLADRLEAAQVPLPMVFGHHDLLPANIMDDGKRLWLIDWEYGAFGTPLFDLANLSANGALDETQDSTLLAAYFDGAVSPELRKAFEAMKAASLLREALWALVSDIHLKTPGIDYQAYAKEYFGRLSRNPLFR
ncbi:MAG: choline kinase [Alphaproteobacteria bacterium]|nr:choline kinase [Alphaproteobacteria bacterium]